MNNLEEDLVDNNWIQRNWPRLKGKIGKAAGIGFLSLMTTITGYALLYAGYSNTYSKDEFKGIGQLPKSEFGRNFLKFDSSLTHKIQVIAIVGREFDPETTDIYAITQKRFWGKDWSYEKEWKMLNDGNFYRFTCE